MTERRNLKKELQYFVYNDPEYGEDIENIHYPALILILQDLVERVEQLEKDNELLKSYAWEND
jgi:cell shape-determining protein MreC